MMRSLYSGISGLKVHQTKMDVIGNNISNVSTVGFRGGSVNFTDVFSQTIQHAAGPNAATGTAGSNALQIGLGANVAAIAVNLSGTGATQRTDRGMDVMINGDAFLIVNSNGNTYFTKSGALDVDVNGTLVCTTNNATVLGWGVDENGDIRKDTAAPLRLMGGEISYSDPNATTDVYLKGNIDQNDPLVAYSEDGEGYIRSISFFDNLGNPCSAKISIMQTSSVSTNTYSVRLVDIMGADGKSLLKRKVTAEDAAADNTLTVGDYITTNFAINYNGNDIGGESGYTVSPSSGEIIFADGTTWPTLTFDPVRGNFVSVSSDDGKMLNLNLSADGMPYPTEGVDIDFSDLTMYASDKTCSVKPNRGDKNGDNAGNAAGSLDGYTIQPDGMIYGVYSNGDKKLLGQIAVATFPNPSGLEAVGNSMYAATLNSGEFDGIGVDISEVGKFTTGTLEMSDVDLATEFTNMITTQRAFQANSRVITTTDSMLEELVNLKR